MSLFFPVGAKLKDGLPVQLVLEDNQDIEPLRSLYRIIVDEWMSYPHDRLPDLDDFMDYWFRGLFWSVIADRMVDKHWAFQQTCLREITAQARYDGKAPSPDLYVSQRMPVVVLASMLKDSEE